MPQGPIRTIDTGTDQLLCELAEGVATITLNRPDKRNALSDVLALALRPHRGSQGGRAGLPGQAQPGL